jgi:cytochrome oxidase Cu insertion factor (SCO1/SenC/PrrC family)
VSTSRTRAGQPRKVRARAAARSKRNRRVLLVGSFAGGLAGALVAMLLIGGRSGSPPPTLSSGPADTSTGQTSSGVAIGRTFPPFRITDVDGRVVTNQTLRGKPAIIWYTTSYCAPCQVGARVVARFEDQLGGSPFNVLVVFVDPRESAAALTRWRDRYGRPDWMVALDSTGTLSEAVRLQFLDSKYLLDARGVVRNIDFTVADRGYLMQILRLLRKAS